LVIINSIEGRPIRLTAERWEHIVRRHPELVNIRDWILDTVREPELILEGDFGELLAARFFPKSPLTAKYILVAYREIEDMDGFIITAYLASRVSERRRVVWKR